MSSSDQTRADSLLPEVVLTRSLNRRAQVVFGVLVVATLISAWLGDGHGTAKAATVAVIGVTFVKAFLVGHYFMEVRTAPLLLRLAFGSWVVGVAGTLIAMYLIG